MLNDDVIRQFSLHPGETGCKRKLTWATVMILDGSSQRFTTLRRNNGGLLSEEFCTNEVGACGCAHAEVSAILATLQSHSYSELQQRHVAMVTLYSPCSNCAHAIISCGFINSVVYNILTEHDKRGVALLQAAKLKVVTLEQIKTEVVVVF